MWVQRTAAGITALTFSADGRTLYALDSRAEICAWDVATRKPRTFAVVGRDVNMSDVRLGTACDDRFVVVIHREAVQVFDPATGAEHSRVPIDPSGHPTSLDPTRRMIVSPSPGRDTLATWDIASKRPGPPLLRAEPGSVDRFSYFAISADGDTVAVSTNRQIAVYDQSAGRAVARFDCYPHFGPLLALAFTPDAQTLALFGLDKVTLWDVESQTVRPGRVWSPMPSYYCAVHPTRPLLAALNRELQATLFSLETGEALRSFDFELGKKVQCTAFSPDGLTCAVGGSGKLFAVFDVDV